MGRAAEDDRIAAGLIAELRSLPGIGPKAAAVVAAHLLEADRLRAEALAAAHLARGGLTAAHEAAREAARVTVIARRASEFCTRDLEELTEWLRRWLDAPSPARKSLARMRGDQLAERTDTAAGRLAAAAAAVETAEAAAAAALDDFDQAIDDPAAVHHPSLPEARPRIVGCLHYAPVTGVYTRQPRFMIDDPERLAAASPLSGRGFGQVEATADWDCCVPIREDEHGGYVDLYCPTCGGPARPKYGSRAKSALIAAGPGRIDCRVCGARLVDSREGPLLAGTMCVRRNAEVLLIEAPETGDPEPDGTTAAAARLAKPRKMDYTLPGPRGGNRRTNRYWTRADREAIVAQVRERLARLDRAEAAT